MMNIEIDQNSGYCFGVEFAIQMAEDELLDGNVLYCLGDIVHNDMEVERLTNKGLVIISRDELKTLKNSRVLIRAHGEPPETYKIALENNLELVDASCPVVLKLQNRVKNAYDKVKDQEGQIVIYGKIGHAEVVGLSGQTKQQAIVVMEEKDLDQIDFTKSITLFSQTTKSTKGFYHFKQLIQERIQQANGGLETVDFKANDSICRQVSNREPILVGFSTTHDIIIFVSGKKSSNGKALYSVCKDHNTRSYFIENGTELDISWFRPDDSVGICGATSTPMWLMQQVADAIEQFDGQLVSIPGD
jgi:4-hydroxy-3-methylbut-2-enyl diphosphate reductase